MSWFRPPQPTLGLALAGGGARGIAHIGVLEVLEKQGLRPAQMAGTSAGAIVAAMYAATLDPAWVAQRFYDFLSSDAYRTLGLERLSRRHDDPDSVNPFSKRLADHVVVHMSLLREFMIPRQKLRAAIEFLVPARDFSELRIPLKVCAADMNAVESLAFNRGDLIEALCDSASIPGVLEPRRIGSQIIADGGMLLPVPVTMLDTDLRIASEISRRGLAPLDEVNIYRLMMRAEQISQIALARAQAARADFAFHPDVLGLHWSQFGAIDALLGNGRAEAEARLPALLQRLEHECSWLGWAERRVRRLASVKRHDRAIKRGGEAEPRQVGDEEYTSEPSPAPETPQQ